MTIDAWAVVTKSVVFISEHFHEFVVDAWALPSMHHGPMGSSQFVPTSSFISGFLLNWRGLISVLIILLPVVAFLSVAVTGKAIQTVHDRVQSEHMHRGY